MQGYIQMRVGSTPCLNIEVFDGDLIGSLPDCRVRLPDAAPGRVARLRCDGEGYWLEPIVPGVLTLPGAGPGELWLNQGSRLRLESLDLELTFTVVETPLNPDGPVSFRELEKSFPQTQTMAHARVPATRVQREDSPRAPIQQKGTRQPRMVSQPTVTAVASERTEPAAAMPQEKTQPRVVAAAPLARPGLPPRTVFSQERTGPPPRTEPSPERTGPPPRTEPSPERTGSPLRTEPSPDRTGPRPGPAMLELSGSVTRRSRLRLRIWTQAAIVGAVVSTLITLGLFAARSASLATVTSAGVLALQGPPDAEVTLSFIPEGGPPVAPGTRITLSSPAASELLTLPAGRAIELVAAADGFLPHRSRFILAPGQRLEHRIVLQTAHGDSPTGPSRAVSRSGISEPAIASDPGITANTHPPPAPGQGVGGRERAPSPDAHVDQARPTTRSHRAGTPGSDKAGPGGPPAGETTKPADRNVPGGGETGGKPANRTGLPADTELDSRAGRKELAAGLGAREVAVEILSTVSGAELKVDGKRLGALPFRRPLPAGEHRFSVYDPVQEVWLSFVATVPPEGLRMRIDPRRRTVAINGQLHPLVGP